MGQEVKNPLRAQSKYGLMESSAKTGKFCFRGSSEHFLDKNAIWDRTPPHTHQLHSTCVGEGSRVPNLQTEFNYLDLFKSYGSFSDFVVPMVPTLSPLSPRRPRVIPVIPTSSPKPPEGPHVVTMAVVSVVSSVVSVVSSVVSVVSTPCCLRGPHIVPVVPHIIPVSSPSSPCHLEGHHIIPNPSDTHSTDPPPPRGVGGP